MENAKTYFARSLLIGNTIELAGGYNFKLEVRRRISFLSVLYALSSICIAEELGKKFSRVLLVK